MEGNEYHRVINMDKNNHTENISTPLPHRERLGSGSPMERLGSGSPMERQGRGSLKIYVAGHKGLVGSAIWNNLLSRGYTNLVGRTHAELDLTDQVAVKRFFDEEQPDAVVLAAAFVGGIMANSLYRADFIMMNMKIQCNVISEAYAHGVKKLLFLGSTCIYPKLAPQPMKEDSLLTSPLEYTNEEYAIAKIAGLKMCESYNLQYGTNYIAVMPTNLYGPNDNFHLENSHVMPAMMRKIYLAKLIHENNWSSIIKDLNKRPIEGIKVQSSKFKDKSSSSF